MASKENQDSEIPPRQQRFIEEYLVDLNATGAAIRAGYASAGARVTGSRLLANPNIKREIASRRQLISERSAVSAAWVVSELAAIAGADISDFVSWVEGEGEGSGKIRLKDPKTIDAAKRRAIVEIAETGNGLKVKLADKIRALEMLSRHLGIFERDNAQKPDSSAVLSAMLSQIGGKSIGPALEGEFTDISDAEDPTEDGEDDGAGG